MYNRRNFLKGTAMGSVGWLLQPSLTRTPADPRFYTVSLPALPQDPIHETGQKDGLREYLLQGETQHSLLLKYT